jgi:hypothetical protein
MLGSIFTQSHSAKIRGQKLRTAKNMIRLEDLQPNAAVRGILPDRVITMVSVQRLSSEATSNPSSIFMTREKITLSELESFLFKAADILRGKMDASEFKELSSVCSFSSAYLMNSTARENFCAEKTLPTLRTQHS